MSCLLVQWFQVLGPKLKCKKKKTVKMNLSRVTQLLVNVSLETEICPRCFVFIGASCVQKLKSNTNWKLLASTLQFPIFFQKFQKQFCWAFLSKYLNIPKGMWGVSSPVVSVLDSERPGFKSWLGHDVVTLSKTLHSHCFVFSDRT